MASFNRPFNTTDRAPPCRAEGGQSSPPFTHATPGRQSTAPTPLDPVHAFLDERLLPVASSSPKGLGAASYCAPPPGERKSSRFVRFVRSKGHRGGPSGSRLGGLVADVCDSANNVATAAPPGGGHGSLIREGRMSRSLRLAAVAALGMAASFALPAGALASCLARRSSATSQSRPPARSRSKTPARSAGTCWWANWQALRRAPDGPSQAGPCPIRPRR